MHLLLLGGTLSRDFFYLSYRPKGPTSCKALLGSSTALVYTKKSRNLHRSIPRMIQLQRFAERIFFTPALGQNCRLGSRRAPFERPTTTPLKINKSPTSQSRAYNLTSTNDTVLGLGFGYKVQVPNFNQYASRHSGEGQPKINPPRLNGTSKFANNWIICRPSPARYR